jgi:hypothetical protein
MEQGRLFQSVEGKLHGDGRQQQSVILPRLVNGNSPGSASPETHREGFPAGADVALLRRVDKDTKPG